MRHFSLLSRVCRVASLVTVLAISHVAHAQMVFNLIDPNNIQASAPQAYAGFQQAAARWSSLFSDNITINLQIGFSALGSGVIGQTSSTDANYTYASTRNALIGDATSSSDALAVANLPNVSGGTAFNMMLNYTSNNPNGAGSPTRFLDNDGDANNTTIRMTNANAKALGLLAANNSATDASIAFSNQMSFDFDPSNGISAGALDFVGVAAHEIGHALGFISGVDILDINSPNGSTFFPDSAFTFVSTLDLYRRSATSLANGGANTIDWSAGLSAAYFSLDGGTTNLANMSTGRTHGDGQQASHWKADDITGITIGIMDPTAANGQLLAITSRDVQALDVIGYTLKTTSAPEPGTLALLLLGAPTLRRRIRRRIA